MTPYQALDVWAEGCDRLGIKWFLYKDTLLCANGYHHFPRELAYAQVAVFAQDLAAVVNDVFPVLPKDWTLGEEELIMNDHLLCFKQGKRIVFAISVLFSSADPERYEELTIDLRRLRSKAERKVKLLTMACELTENCPVKPVGRFLKSATGKARTNAFRQILSKLVELSGSCKSGQPCLFDDFVPKKAVMLEKALFADTTMINCMVGDGEFARETAYPVFSGYREYLEMVYGDYENGLFDEIGCGLTVEDKEELKRHQARCTEALAFVQRISQEYNLRYYLLAGSVLGAVRHGGFIPWDDDVDIGIRVDELERFEAAIKENLPEGFTLMQAAADDPYPRMFSKICYDGRCCIDLWPLIPTYTEGFRAVYTWYFGKIITKAHYSQIGHEVNNFRKIVRVLDVFLNDRQIMWLARRNERRYADRNTPAYINLYSIYRRDKENILRRWLDDEATAVFEGIEVPVVGCTEEYLTHLYGDFMSCPPAWKRASRHVARF